MIPVEDIGADVVAAVAARDHVALSQLFAPEVRLRALIPPGPVERNGAEESATLIGSWFADAEIFGLVGSEVSTVADRLHVRYQFVGTEEGDDFIVEQQMYAQVEGGKLTDVTLLCSGFRPRT